VFSFPRETPTRGSAPGPGTGVSAPHAPHPCYPQPKASGSAPDSHLSLPYKTTAEQTSVEVERTLDKRVGVLLCEVVE